ncbi:MAG: LamG-like jellyroll fold domain-containing protein [Actinomycetota bacterium]
MVCTREYTSSTARRQWNHIAITWDNTNVRLFVNGVQAVSVVYAFVRQDTNYPVIFGKNINPTPSFSGKLDEVSFYNRNLSANEIKSIFSAGLAGKLKTANTPIGFSAKESDVFSPQTVSTTVGDVTATFQNVSVAGTTQEIPFNLSLLPALPSGTTSAGLTYDIATSAGYSGNVDLSFNLGALSALNFNNLRVYHLENGVWVDRTAAGNVSPTLCTSGVASLSPFAIVNIAPTAANVSVSGRVTDASGNAVARVRVSISNSNGIIRTASTNSFGFYRFDEIPAGESYVVSAAHKHYQFAPLTQVVVVNDAVSDIDFTAIE